MSSITDCRISKGVEVQGFLSGMKKTGNNIGNSAKKAGVGIGNLANQTAIAMGVNPGQVGYPCKKNKSCNTRNCASGLCQEKFDAGGPCKKGVQCKGGSCKVKCLSNGKSCGKDSDCCKGGCWNFKCDKSA